MKAEDVKVDFNELKEYFTELQKELPKDANLSFVKSFHLTLKFLGEVKPNKIDEIIDIFRKIESRNFPVNLDSIGIFPNPDKLALAMSMLI